MDDVDEFAKQCVEKLRGMTSDDDIERAHSEADAILCELLMKLGYVGVVRAWADVPKWYA